MLTCRQAGKSTTAAAVALVQALLIPRSLILLLSPSLRQSAELFRKVTELHRAMGGPLATPATSALRCKLSNHTRIVSLPSTENTIRGFSRVDLLVVDEAARVPDALYFSVRPMLSVSRGRLLALSTPFGRRGWFHHAWAGGESWERVRVVATDVGRIPPEFLEEERRTLGPRWYAQEYECSFEDIEGALFDGESIDAAFAGSTDEAPIFGA